MKKIFDGLISRLYITKERIVEHEDRLIETSPTGIPIEKRMEKIPTKGRTDHPRTIGTISKGMYSWNNRRRKREQKKYLKQ